MKNKTSIIIDYGRGNLFSIEQAVRYAGGHPEITNDPEKIRTANRLILPGVGAFGVAVKALEAQGLTDAILEFVQTERPLMGICLGMQLLFDTSHEFGKHAGLELIHGEVVRFNPPDSTTTPFKIPHVGWSWLERPYLRQNDGLNRSSAWERTILHDTETKDRFYFVHSYRCVPRDHDVVLAETYYGLDRFASVVNRDNIWGCQFHPEKSGEPGLAIYKCFLEQT